MGRKLRWFWRESTESISKFKDEQQGKSKGKKEQQQQGMLGTVPVPKALGGTGD
jgi:hypothetical protein